MDDGLFFNLADIKGDTTPDNLNPEDKTNLQALDDNNNPDNPDDDNTNPDDIQDLDTDPNDPPGDTDEEEGTPGDIDPNSSTLSVFAQLLRNQGVLSSEIEGLEDIQDVDGFSAVIAKQVEIAKQQGADERFNNLSESQRRYLEAVELGVPKSEFEELESDLNFLENLSMEQIEANPQLRFDLIVDDLMLSGLSQERAVEIGNRAVKAGTDKEDAVAAANNMMAVKAKNYQESVSQIKEDKRISLEKVQDFVNSKEAVLEMKLTPELKTKVYDAMTIGVDTDEAGNPLNAFGKWRQENGLEAELVLNALFIQTNGFKNLGSIGREIGSHKSLELTNKLKGLDMEDLGRQIGRGAAKPKGLTLA